MVITQFGLAVNVFECPNICPDELEQLPAKFFSDFQSLVREKLKTERSQENHGIKYIFKALIV